MGALAGGFAGAAFAPAAEVTGAVGAGEACGATAAPPPATCAGSDATVVASAAGGVWGSAACGNTVDGATDELLESIGTVVLASPTCTRSEGW